MIGFPTIDYFSQFLPIVYQIFLALLCGGAIGLERQRKYKPAGLRTNIMICLGAMLYTVLSVLIGEATRQSGVWGADPARIAAQIVVGIGFLGGGMIIQSRGSVTGLTSAATVWMVAAIGMCIGLGYFFIATVFTLIVLFALRTLSFVERRFFGKLQRYKLRISLDSKDIKSRSEASKVFSYMDLDVENFSVSAKAHTTLLSVCYLCTSVRHVRIKSILWGISGVKDIEVRVTPI